MNFIIPVDSISLLNRKLNTSKAFIAELRHRIIGYVQYYLQQPLFINMFIDVQNCNEVCLRHNSKSFENIISHYTKNSMQ